MGVENRVGIFVNPDARKDITDQTLNFAERLPNAEIFPLRFPLDRIPDSLKTAIVVGGDGSVKGVVEKLLEKDNPPNLLVLPGGSENGFYRSLVHANATVPFKKVGFDPEEKYSLFHPGMINGHIFVNAAGWGKIEIQNAKVNEQLRYHLPRNIRGKIVNLLVSAPELVSNDRADPFVQIALTQSCWLNLFYLRSVHHLIMYLHRDYLR